MLKRLIDYFFNRRPVDPVCKDCGHTLSDHCGGPEGMCILCKCMGWADK